MCASFQQSSRPFSGAVSRPKSLRRGFPGSQGSRPGPRKAAAAGSAQGSAQGSTQGWLQAEQGRTRRMRSGTKTHARGTAGASLSGAGSGHAVSHVFPIARTQICAPPHTHTPTLPRLLLSRNVHNKSQQPGTLPPCCMCQTASRGGTRSPQLGSQRQAAARLPDLHPGLSRAAGCLRPRRHRGNLASTLASAQPSRWRRTPPSPPPAPPERLSQLSPNWGSGKSSQERSPQPRLERRSERARGGG